MHESESAPKCVIGGPVPTTDARELFEAFIVQDVGTVVMRHPTQRQILVQPLLRLAVAHRLTDEWPALIGENAPPMRWLP